ncbi:MAG: hypothetical protein PGMFKBFP_01750 [Anaerolineales bacterium]|nr:hypothetical protein [Anaerolineales bacterium]
MRGGKSEQGAEEEGVRRAAADAQDENPHEEDAGRGRQRDESQRGEPPVAAEEEGQRGGRSAQEEQRQRMDGAADGVSLRAAEARLPEVRVGGEEGVVQAEAVEGRVEAARQNGGTDEDGRGCVQPREMRLEPAAEGGAACGVESVL